MAFAALAAVSVGAGAQPEQSSLDFGVTACQDTKIRHIDCASAQFYEAYDPGADKFSHPIQGGVKHSGDAVHVRVCDERNGPRGLIVREFGEWCYVSRNCVTGYH
jgi:hypothetical protein